MIMGTNMVHKTGARDSPFTISQELDTPLPHTFGTLELDETTKLGLKTLFEEKKPGSLRVKVAFS